MKKAEGRPGNLRDRTKQFALRIVGLYGHLPKSTEAQVIGRQVLRSGTSIGAHYREACRARSTAEFVSRIETGLQELDETVYWLELLAEGGIAKPASLNALQSEADELIAIFVSVARKAKRGTGQLAAGSRTPSIKETGLLDSSFRLLPSSLLVTVFGGARVPETSPLYADCLTLGRLLAEAGCSVATGGYTGTMEAVLRGAAEAGAQTVGYTCSIFDRDFRPNRWVLEEHKTDSLSSRIQRMADESDAFVVVHGGLGTLAELALVWNMMLAGEASPRPIIVVGPEWPRVLSTLYAESQMGSSALQLLTLVETPQQAIQHLRAELPESSR